MAENILDLILRIRKQGTGGKDTIADIDAIKASGRGLVGSLTDIKSGFDMAFGAVQTVLGKAQQAFDTTIGAAASWGDAMGDLAQLTGTTVEETSELAATFKILGIEQDKLGRIVKAFTTQGLQPTMANVRALAAEYQAIQDPVERNEFLFKRFGKQAEDIAEILGKSTEELDQFTAAARASGKVIGEEAAVQAEKFNIQVAILQQRAEGIGISLGNVAIPAINSFTDNLLKANQSTADATITFLQNAGVIDEQQAALRRAAVASGDVFAALTNQEAQTVTLTGVTDEQIATYKLLRTMYTDASTASGEFTAAMSYELTAADKLTVGLKSYNEQLLFSLASANMDAEAALNLGVALGVVDEKSLRAAEGVADLKEKYDSNADGAISAAEAARGYTADILALNDSLNGIPRSIPVRIEFTKVGDEDFGGWTPPKGSGSSTKTSTSEEDATPGQPRATGGPVLPGVPYLIGERGAEMLWPETNGFVMNNNDMRRMLGALEAIAGGGRNVVNMSINTQSAPSETMLGGYLRALAGAF